MPQYPLVQELPDEILTSALLLADEILLHNHNEVGLSRKERKQLKARRADLSREVDRRDMGVGQSVIVAVFGY